MQHADRLASVRRQVDDSFRAHGVPDDDPICETLLIKDGHYYGRRFSRDRFHAVWVVASDVVEVFGCQNELLESLEPLGTSEEWVRKAA